MKLFSLIFLAAVLFADSSYAALADNIVAYWRLEEASSNATDQRRAHNLTETSSTIGRVAGKVGNARDFVLADTEYFAKASHADLVNVDDEYTLACWVNIRTKGAGNQTILAKGTDG